MWKLNTLSKRSALLYGNSFADRTFRGSLLTVFTFGGQTFLRLASNLILTRILFPEAFGLMALVQVVLSGAAQFSDIGIRSSVVRDERGADTAFLHTAWTLQILRGFILGIVVFFLAEPVAAFYSSPELSSLIKFCAAVPIIQGFNSTRMLSANRNIQFGRLTTLMIGEHIFNILLTILLSLWLGSVWALAIGTVIGAITICILSHTILEGESNWFALEKDAVRRMFRFGKYIFLSTLAGYFLSQGDKIVLGRYVSLEDLAIYNIGYLLAAMPLLLSGMLNERIFYPLYARIPPLESTENRKQINRVRFFVTSGMILAATAVSFVGDPLVRVLYDSRYHNAGPILTLIALSFMPRLITFSYERVTLAGGHSGRFAVFTISVASLQLIFLLFGVNQFGLLGAIMAPPAATLATYPLMLWINWRYKAWHPLHDLLFFFAASVLSIAIIIYRWPVVSSLFEGSSL
ncbi:MAG: oligosaccharide flippase family protein [Pseudomonadota bacterium]